MTMPQVKKNKHRPAVNSSDAFDECIETGGANVMSPARMQQNKQNSGPFLFAHQLHAIFQRDLL